MKKLSILLSMAWMLCNICAWAQSPIPTVSIKGISAKEVKIVSESVYATPGQSFKIGVEVITQSGVTLKTKGFLNGDLAWREFDVTVMGGEYTMTLPGQIKVSEKQADFINDCVKIIIIGRENASIKAELFVPVSYIQEIKMSYTAGMGATGAVGKEGTFANGGNGIGEKGANGSKGSTGPKIEVYVKPLTLNKLSLYDIRIVNTQTGKEDKFRLNPNGGKLMVYSIGGPGGAGGQGGAGTSNKEKCITTDGAPGGNGGEGGEGGEIIFIVDPSIKNYQTVLTGYSQGGKGGVGGKGGSGGGIVSCTGSITKPGKKGQEGANGADGRAGVAPTYK